MSSRNFRNSLPHEADEVFDQVRQTLDDGAEQLSPVARQRIRSSIFSRAPARRRSSRLLVGAAWIVASGVAVAAGSNLFSRSATDATPQMSGAIAPADLPIGAAPTERRASQASAPTAREKTAPEPPAEPSAASGSNSARSAQPKALSQPRRSTPSAPPQVKPGLPRPVLAPATGEPTSDVTEFAAPDPSASPAPPADSLQAELDAYRAAMAVLPSSPAAALAALRAHARRWPTSPLRHEVDLRIIQASLRLGLTGDAAREARGFLTRHPHSPRLEEVRALATRGSQ